MKPPKTSFSAVLQEATPPKDYSTEENQMAWKIAVIEAIKTIGGSLGRSLKRTGEQAVDDVVDIVEDHTEAFKREILSEFNFERMTHDFIVNLKPDDLQYLANRVAIARKTILQVESEVAYAARLVYTKKIKTDLTAYEVDEVKALIESFKKKR